MWRQRSKSIQIDIDGVPDLDGECLLDSINSLPVRVATEWQVDTNTNSDGVPDCEDECLEDSNKSLPVRVVAEKQVDTDRQRRGARLRR
jgi:hypothetical protein